MRINIFLLTFFLSFNLLADSETESQVSLCEKEADKFGNGEGSDSISESCLELFAKLANPQSKKSTLDKKVSIIGYRNLLIVTSNLKRTLIAGEYTHLKHVVALSYDEKNREIAVLEDSGDILTFSSVITGNVAPLRMIRHAEIEGAADLAILPERNEIAVLHGPKKELLFFSRLGNFHGREGRKNLGIRRQVQQVEGESLTLSDSGKELLIKKRTGLSRYQLPPVKTQ